MKIITLRFFLKLIILTSFIIERILYYKQFSPEEAKDKSIHHELLKGWEIDFGKVDIKFSQHPIFRLPYTRKSINNLKELLINHFNLNTTVSHQKHEHSQDPTHTYYNKVVDIDTKFKFYFLTSYDILISTLLIFSLIADYKLAGLFYLIDISLKIFAMFYNPVFTHQIVHLFSGKPKEFFNYLLTEKSDLAKIVNFVAIVFLVFIQSIYHKNKIETSKFINNSDVKFEKEKNINDLSHNSNNFGDVDGHNYVATAKPISLERTKERKRNLSPSGRHKIPRGNF